MRKLTISTMPCLVDDILEGYFIDRKPSSNVEFHGTDGKNIFIQFKNGASYLYLNVSAEHIEEMKKAESIGRFISVLSKNYQYTKVDQRLINAVQEEVAK
jgi:hypothetical protein